MKDPWYQCPEDPDCLGSSYERPLGTSVQRILTVFHRRIPDSQDPPDTVQRCARGGSQTVRILWTWCKGAQEEDPRQSGSSGHGAKVRKRRIPDSQDPPDTSAGTFPGGSQTACQDPPLASGCRGTFPGGSRSSSTSVGTWPRGSQVVRILIPGDLNRRIPGVMG